MGVGRVTDTAATESTYGTSDPRTQPTDSFATAATERVYAVGVIRLFDQEDVEVNSEVGTYVEGGPGKVSLIAMSDGTVRWAK